jgi:hypothetical protein
MILRNFEVASKARQHRTQLVLVALKPGLISNLVYASEGAEANSSGSIVAPSQCAYGPTHHYISATTQLNVI